MANIVEIIIRGIDKIGNALNRPIRDLQDLSKVAAGLGAAFGVSAAGVAASVALMVRSSISFGHEIEKLSQKTGIGAATLSGLAYAADISDVSLESLDEGLKKFSKSAQEARDAGSPTGKVFKELGINVEDVNGNLKPTDVLFLEVADALSKYEEGMWKSATMTKLFGRAGADLVPMVNLGRDGFNRLAAEGKQLGRVLSDEDARAAADFEENLKRLKASGQGLGQSISRELLPPLNDFLSVVISLNKEHQLAPTFVKAWITSLKLLRPELAALGRYVDSVNGKGGGAVTVKRPAEGWPGEKKTGPKPGPTDKELAAQKKIEDDAFKHAIGLLKERTEPLQAFYGDDAELAKIAADEEIKAFEGRNKIQQKGIAYAQELRGTMDSLGVVDFESELADAMPRLDELAQKMKSLTPEQEFKPLIDLGDVEIAIETINAGYGEMILKQEQFTTKVEGYKEAWLAAAQGVKVNAEAWAAFQEQEEKFNLAERFGDVGLAIQQINEGLGDQWIQLEEGQTMIDAYKEVWMAAHKTITTSAVQIGLSIRDGLVDTITDVVMGAKTAGEAFAELGKMVIRMIVQTALEWIVNRMIMAVVGKSIAAAELLATIPIATAYANMWAPAAAMAAVATLGGAGIAGAAALTATLGTATGIAAMTPALAMGGAAHAGLTSVPEESTFLLKRGERVLSPPQNEDLTEFLEGGGGAPAEINVYIGAEKLFKIIAKGIRQGRLQVVTT